MVQMIRRFRTVLVGAMRITHRSEIMHAGDALFRVIVAATVRCAYFRFHIGRTEHLGGFLFDVMMDWVDGIRHVTLRS